MSNVSIDVTTNDHLPVSLLTDDQMTAVRDNMKHATTEWVGYYMVSALQDVLIRFPAAAERLDKRFKNTQDNPGPVVVLDALREELSDEAQEVAFTFHRLDDALALLAERRAAETPAAE